MDTIAGMKESLTIRLDDDLRAWLDRIAQQEDRSVSSMVRVLLVEARTAREGK
jgi:predicted transcriptional regulator